MHNRIKKALAIFACFFAIQLMYMSYIELWGKKDYMANSYNKRLQIQNTMVKRGTIYDKNGVVLAESVLEGKYYKRVYPYEALYAHVVGYHSEVYGTTQLEAKYNAFLMPDQSNLFQQVASKIEQSHMRGDALHLTLDHDLQEKARALLGNNNGSIVALDPRTGQVLAMVSTPDFDPSDAVLQDKWSTLIEDKNSPLLPRAVSGLYPPGSTFKIVTGISALENSLGAFSWVDTGSISIDGKVFKNAGDVSYGYLDLKSAMTYSSNVYFAALSEKLGEEALLSSAEKVGFNQPIPFDLSVTASRFPEIKGKKTELAATAIGQGKLQVTPLQMALVTSGIANKGVVMTPYVVDIIKDSTGVLIKKTKPSPWLTFTSEVNAALVKEMMVQVVREGTGKKASVKNITVAGKTGTAQVENAKGQIETTHGWFVGFAPAENPEIVVAILLENQKDNGGANATPLAAQLFSQWLK